MFFECYAGFHVCPQPEKAFEVYQLGMKKNPRSTALASKTGKALIKSHYYFKVCVVHFFNHKLHLFREGGNYADILLVLNRR